MIQHVKTQSEKNKQVLLHLLLISGVGPRAIFKIINHYFPEQAVNAPENTKKFKPFDLSQLYVMKKSDFYSFGLSKELSEKLVQGLTDSTALLRELDLLAKNNINLISWFDDEYPELLRHIHLPPYLLYCKGQPLKKSEKSFAIVGSRKACDYAQRVLHTLIPGLVDRGWTIVSGGAYGADTMAHQQALVSGGRTVAVLGSGLLNIYPAENRKLFDQLCQEGGSLISSFPLLSPPERGNFPARNRIIAGLSQGCLVVQAAGRSGALITADFALEQGRSVFAVPGSIFKDLSVGCHKLIASGAKVVTSVDDILEEFGEHLSGSSSKKVQTSDKNAQMTIQMEQIKDPVLKVLDAACSLDELSTRSGISLADLQNKLFDLQLDGKVRQNYSGLWERVDG